MGITLRVLCAGNDRNRSINGNNSARTAHVNDRNRREYIATSIHVAWTGIDEMQVIANYNRSGYGAAIAQARLLWHLVLISSTLINALILALIMSGQIPNAAERAHRERLALEHFNIITDVVCDGQTGSLISVSGIPAQSIRKPFLRSLVNRHKNAVGVSSGDLSWMTRDELLEKMRCACLRGRASGFSQAQTPMPMSPPFRTTPAHPRTPTHPFAPMMAQRTTQQLGRGRAWPFLFSPLVGHQNRPQFPAQPTFQLPGGGLMSPLPPLRRVDATFAGATGANARSRQHSGHWNSNAPVVCNRQPDRAGSRDSSSGQLCWGQANWSSVEGNLSLTRDDAASGPANVFAPNCDRGESSERHSSASQDTSGKDGGQEGAETGKVGNVKEREPSSSHETAVKDVGQEGADKGKAGGEAESHPSSSQDSLDKAGDESERDPSPSQDPAGKDGGQGGAVRGNVVNEASPESALESERDLSFSPQSEARTVAAAESEREPSSFPTSARKDGVPECAVRVKPIPSNEAGLEDDNDQDAQPPDEDDEVAAAPSDNFDDLNERELSSFPNSARKEGVPEGAVGGKPKPSNEACLEDDNDLDAPLPYEDDDFPAAPPDNDGESLFDDDDDDAHDVVLAHNSHQDETNPSPCCNDGPTEAARNANPDGETGPGDSSKASGPSLQQIGTQNHLPALSDLFEFISRRERLDSMRPGDAQHIEFNEGWEHPLPQVPHFSDPIANYTQKDPALLLDQILRPSHSVYPVSPSKDWEEVPGIMMFKQDNYGIDRIFWFFKQLEDPAEAVGPTWQHMLTRMWSSDDLDMLERFRCHNFRRALTLKEIAGTESSQILRDYLERPPATLPVSSVDIEILCDVYHAVSGIPVVLLMGLSKLVPGKRFSDRYECLAKTEHVHHKGRIPIFVLEHLHTDLTGCDSVQTLDLILPPPKSSLSRAPSVSMYTNDFYPFLCALEGDTGYVPKYEYIFPLGSIGNDLVDACGVEFYPLPPLPNPNELAPSSQMLLEPWQVEKHLALERSIATVLVDPCHQAKGDARDLRVFRFSTYLFERMLDHYFANRSILPGATFRPTELVDPLFEPDLWLKLRFYSRALRRTILLFSIHDDGPGGLVLREPQPGIATKWPCLIIGVKGFSSSPDGSHKSLLFTPSCMCGRGRQDLPPFAEFTDTADDAPNGSGKKTDFLHKSVQFDDLCPPVQVQRCLRADIDGFLILSDSIGQFADTFVGPNGSGKYPCILLKRRLRPSMNDTTCSFDLCTWRDEDSTVWAPLKDVDRGIVVDAGACNLFHLPTIWIGQARISNLRYGFTFLCNAAKHHTHH